MVPQDVLFLFVSILSAQKQSEGKGRRRERKQRGEKHLCSSASSAYVQVQSPKPILQRQMVSGPPCTQELPVLTGQSSLQSHFFRVRWFQGHPVPKNSTSTSIPVVLLFMSERPQHSPSSPQHPTPDYLWATSSQRVRAV